MLVVKCQDYSKFLCAVKKQFHMIWFFSFQSPVKKQYQTESLVKENCELHKFFLVQIFFSFLNMSGVTINFVMLQAVIANLADGDVDIVLPSDSEHIRQ